MSTAKQFISPNLLEAGNHALILIDQQYLQLLTIRSHDATIVVNAKALSANGSITNPFYIGFGEPR
jgi:hypothetical protein